MMSTKILDIVGCVNPDHQTQKHVFVGLNSWNYLQRPNEHPKKFHQKNRNWPAIIKFGHGELLQDNKVFPKKLFGTKYSRIILSKICVRQPKQTISLQFFSRLMKIL